MSGLKRRHSSTTYASRKTVRLAAASSGVQDEEGDMESILEQIRQQDESEALAQKLQQEFDAPEITPVIDLITDVDASAPSNHGIGSSQHEDDEAMARRLAREWEELDAAEAPSTVSVVASKPLTTSTSARIVNLENPEDELLKHRDIFTRSRECTKCGKEVVSPRNLVIFSAMTPPPTLLALLHAVCTACGQSHCRGCFRALGCAKNCKGKHCDVANCCAEVRAIGLFEALGGFDRQYIGERLNSSKDHKCSNRRQKVATVGPGGTGYGSGSHGSYSLRNTHQSEYQLDQKAAESSKAIAARWDDIVLRAFETITHLLPSPYSDNAATYDLLPHMSIRALISLSYLPELLGSLLINDSVTDWVERSNVYNALLRLLRRMADSELSVGVLIGGRPEKRKSVGLDDWMWGDGAIEWETRPGTKDIVRAPPLYDHFKKLTKQCETFLTGASHLLEDGGGDGGEVEDMTVRATSLCGDMISAQQDMQRALSVVVCGETVEQDADPKTKGKSRDPNVEMEKKYCATCEELAFKHVTLSSDLPTGGLGQPAKRLHLIKELSATSTSLPPGVWVRVDEVRNDIMKIMIAGPEGTPYAGGLFEFHCFLPLEYPNVSPKMTLRTTAGGRVRFNPNLYSSGNVCLSLLGTWPGRPEEEWSSKSTLLQVLVSIQSMILVDAPFFNEPGFGEARLDDPRSAEYNKNIALQTVRWAMVDWMQEDHRTGIWADVIANHFSIRQRKIRECIRKWIINDPRFRNYQASSTATAGNADMYPRPGQHQPCPAEPPGLNLLDEFDRGCALVESWLEHQ